MSYMLTGVPRLVNQFGRLKKITCFLTKDVRIEFNRCINWVLPSVTPLSNQLALETTVVKLNHMWQPPSTLWIFVCVRFRGKIHHSQSKEQCFTFCVSHALPLEHPHPPLPLSFRQNKMLCNNVRPVHQSEPYVQSREGSGRAHGITWRN